MAELFVLQPGSQRHANDIGDVFLAARQQALTFLPALDADDECRIRSWIRDTVLPTTVVWVAEVDGRVAGFFSLDGEKLKHLYVHPRFHSQQIGTALLQHARSLAPLRLELYTFARNEGARRFYERHGFRAVAFGQENEENEPDVLYEWKAGSAD
ncbi:MAG: GNAT family N-acetyltransferase [Actinomycetota bacterium]|nr:GNAT family N-acetyltransferase [Actinomycetota bacterium]